MASTASREVSISVMIEFDPVKCVLAIQDVSKECPWFKRAVTDVRMLRIEENNDLMPAVGEPDLGLAPSPERQPIMVSQILES